MTKYSNRDKSLTPYQQVAIEYTILHPDEKMTATKAQRIGMSALAKMKRELKRQGGRRWIYQEQ